jgi:hypothetical protein
MSLQILTLKLDGITAGDYLTWCRDPDPPALDYGLCSIALQRAINPGGGMEPNRVAVKDGVHRLIADVGGGGQGGDVDVAFDHKLAEPGRVDIVDKGRGAH